MIEQIKTYRQDPDFAWKQAVELMQNQQAYMTIISGYLILKGSADPRKRTKASYSEEQVFDLIFGEQIQYFEATFGEQFSLTK